jgi:hypothetical protein
MPHISREMSYALVGLDIWPRICIQGTDRPWGQLKRRRKTMASKKSTKKLGKAKVLKHTKPLSLHSKVSSVS